MRRTSYQFGWIDKKERAGGPNVWVYRYREPKPDGSKQQISMVIGTVEEYPTKAVARRAAEHLRLTANPDWPAACSITLGAVVDRYVDEEIPELRHSSGKSYLSYLERYIRPKWGEYQVVKVRAFAVEQWLKSLDMAPKSKGHIHNLMRVLFNCAMRWEILPYGENPMKLVRVRGVSKREHEPRVLTISECHLLLDHIQEEPFRTMIFLDMATGLRCSELLALRWRDFHWHDASMLIRRAIVDGVVDNVKTKYSKAGMPLDGDLARILSNWRKKSRFSQDEDWVFASPAQNGRMPFRAWGVQQRHLRPAGIQAGLGAIGWHTLRHTFSSLLRANGEDLKVQQELLRHADIRTTMNVYTQAVSEQKRRAQSRVVRMMLAPELGNIGRQEEKFVAQKA